jgi:hypothetical protein
MYWSLSGFGLYLMFDGVEIDTCLLNFRQNKIIRTTGRQEPPLEMSHLGKIKEGENYGV